jgi:THO complex subunit 7
VDELQETMEDEQKSMVEEMQRNITADGAEAMSID